MSEQRTSDPPDRSARLPPDGLPDLVLASSSPRRRELLAQLGLTFRVMPPDVDETHLVGERPRALVARLAATKARTVNGEPVIAADTVVEIDGAVLGKPVSESDARAMLRRLSGRAHHVHTGVTVRSGERVETEVVTTQVQFVALTPGVVDWYLGTGEPFGKAGAYAIQGAGAVLVDSVHGSVSNVVGLPLATVVTLLHRVTGWSL